MSDEIQAVEDVEVEQADYLVRCNSCGRVQRKSDPAQCQCKSPGSWSYEGPLPVEEKTSLEAAIEAMNGSGPMTVDHVIEVIQDIIDAPETDDEIVAEADQMHAAHPVFMPPELGNHRLENDGENEGYLGDEDAAIDEILDAEEDEVEGPSEEELADDLRSIAEEKAIAHMFDVQDRLDSAIEDHAEKADVAKTAKKRVESLQEDLSMAVRAVREARTASEPDPARYPLLDGPKAEINSMFAKPEAIPPLPPDTQDEFMRIKRRDTRLDAIGISSRVTTALAKAGYHTVADIGKLTEASAPLTSVKGIGEAAAGEIIDRLCDVGQQWVTEWQQTHPESVE